MRLSLTNIPTGDVIVTHPGTHHSYMTAQAIQDEGRLQNYITSFFYLSETWWGRVCGTLPPMRKWMARRFCASLDQGRIRCVPQYELVEKALDRTFFRKQTSNRRVYWRDRAFDAKVARRYVTEQTRVVIGYPNACLRSFQAVTEQGGKAVLDLPIGYFRKAASIFNEEKNLHPEFADSITYSQFDSTYAERVDQEIALADYVLVPSDFVRTSLTEFGIPERKIVKIPYGSWLEPVKPRELSNTLERGTLRIVYFGQITQRKGLKYLLDAIKTVRKCGLDLKVTLAGRLFGSCDWVNKYSECLSYVGLMSRAELRRLLLEHDLFVFPTLFEGSAYVIPEALSHGLPVITTSHSGAECLEEGRNGFFVPIRDSFAIAEHLMRLAEDPEELLQLKRNALESSREITWNRYAALLRTWFRGVE